MQKQNPFSFFIKDILFSPVKLLHAFSAIVFSAVCVWCSVLVAEQEIVFSAVTQNNAVIVSQGPRVLGAYSSLAGDSSSGENFSVLVPRDAFVSGKLVVGENVSMALNLRTVPSELTFSFKGLGSEILHLLIPDILPSKIAVVKQGEVLFVFFDDVLVAQRVLVKPSEPLYVRTVQEGVKILPRALGAPELSR